MLDAERTRVKRTSPGIPLAKGTARAKIRCNTCEGGSVDEKTESVDNRLSTHPAGLGLIRRSCPQIHNPFASCCTWSWRPPTNYRSHSSFAFANITSGDQPSPPLTPADPEHNNIHQFMWVLPIARGLPARRLWMTEYKDLIGFCGIARGTSVERPCPLDRLTI